MKTKLFTLAGTLSLALFSSATPIIDGISGFGTGGLGSASIDGNWHGNSSGFSIAANTLTHDPAGLASDGAREGLAGRMVDLSSVSGSTLRLSFDYDIGVGNALFAHLRGFDATGGSPSWSQTTWATNGNAWDTATQGVAVNFFDGLLLADSGDANNGGVDEAVALTGSGNYSIEIDLGTYPLNNLGEYEYLMLGFAANVSQQGNTSTINNLLLEAIPEPSSLVLLGAGVAMLLAVRRRAMRA